MEELVTKEDLRLLMFMMKIYKELIIERARMKKRLNLKKNQYLKIKKKI